MREESGVRSVCSVHDAIVGLKPRPSSDTSIMSPSACHSGGHGPRLCLNVFPSVHQQLSNGLEQQHGLGFGKSQLLLGNGTPIATSRSQRLPPRHFEVGAEREDWKTGGLSSVTQPLCVTACTAPSPRPRRGIQTVK